MIKLASYFTGFSSKADGSASLRFSTQEISADDFSNLKENHNAFGWLIFSPNEYEEVPSEKLEEEGTSPSKRLRNRCFVYWKQKVNDGDFNVWYARYLEKVGDNLLQKLE